VLAEYHCQLHYNWSAAEREMAKALQLDPASPLVRLRYAVAILMPHNRVGEAIREVECALELDPLSTRTQAWLGAMFLYRGGDYKHRAIVEARRLQELQPTSPWSHLIIGIACRQKYADSASAGHPIRELADESIREHRMAVELAPGLDYFRGWLGLALGVCGREAEARELLAQLEGSERYTLPTNLGQIHLGLGEIDATFECFDRAVEERDQTMMAILGYLHWDPLHSDPRFGDLLRKMNLV